ncbi:hypothetical protein TNCV_565381 [Trichonephila clavipes]|nr:hypothetical protein TNCV_565381 [Trichonephila clavipes]
MDILKLNKAKTFFINLHGQRPNMPEVKLKKIDQLQMKIEELKELLFGLETAKPTEEAEFEEDLFKCETRLDDLEVRVKKLINSINVSLSVTAVEKTNTKTELLLKQKFHL